MLFSLTNYDKFHLIMAVISTFGYIKLFQKCKIEKKYAFIPYYRFYKLADFLNMDEEGSMFVGLYVVYYLCWASLFSLNMLQKSHIRTTVFLNVVSVVVTIAALIYQIRIFLELDKNFHAKKAWILLWIFADYITVLIWGFSDKFQPTLPKNFTAAGESGYTAESLSEGLTINIDSRKVKSGLKTRYLLRDIHLNIETGKMVLLLGGSGAGKTTFVNAVNGYEKADAEILLDNSNVYKNYNRLKYKIGFVPQQDLIRYEDTVQNTLNDSAKLRLPSNVSHEKRKKRVDEVMELFGLTPVKDNLVGKQSGGQKKRISIASEFISDPSLFILDEPDSGLDGILARELMQRLHNISREGKIVIVITHTPDRVIDLFDEVIVLGKDANRTGRLVFHGSIEKARTFFGVEKMEEIVRKINRVEEGGEGLADSLIEKYAEVCHESSAS